jgi:hypothetical protein
MALENGNGSGNGMVMPVSPMYGGGNGGFGNGFGGDWGWIILLLLFASGGWGNGFGGGNMGGFAPYAIDTGVQRGFDQAAIMSGIGDINAGINGIQSAICNGFAQAEIANNARQIADMQQMFALQSSLQNCCCENRLGIANLGSDIAREACATRTNDTQNTQSILNVINGGIQSIKDQLCSDKIDSKNEKIAELQNALNMATLRESHTAQNAFISQGFEREVDALYNRLNTCPVPSMPVYGRTPIFTCGSQNTGCGCGM